MIAKTEHLTSIVAKFLGHDWLRQVNIGLVFLFPVALLTVRTLAECILVLVVISFLFHCCRTRHWTWLKDPVVTVAMVIWVFLNLVVSPLAADPDSSFGRSLPWVRFILFYAAMTAWLLTDRRTLQLLAWWMAALLAVVAADVLIQHYSGTSITGAEALEGLALEESDVGRLTGFVDVSVGMAMAKLGFPVCGLLLCVGYVMSRRWETMASIGLGLFLLFTVIATGERGATILTLFNLLLVLTSSAICYPHRWRAAVSFLLGMICVGTSAFFLIDRIRHRMDHMVTGLLDIGNTTYGQIVAGAWHVFTMHPLSGVGLKNFRTVDLPHVYTHWEFAGLPPVHPHNIYMEWLSETGGIGFLLFLGLVACLFIKFVRETARNSVNIVIAVVLLGTLVISFFPFTFSRSFFSNGPAMLLWFSVTLAITAVSCNWRQER